MNLLYTLALFSLAFFCGCPQKKGGATVDEPVPAQAAPQAEDTGPAATPAEVDRVQELINKILGNKIFFDFDKAQITPEGKKILAEVGDIMKENEIGKKITVEIGGHTDAIGTEEYNMALGERRAKAVQDYLESYGVEEGRINFTSFGEEQPAAEGQDESSHAQNRRAEFKARAMIK